MSKYTDAFNDIVDHGISIDYFNKEAEKPNDENTILIIQELVNKEIPMKPIKTKWEYACGKCMNAIHVENEIHCEVYCDNCSQKIDWSDIE